MTACKTTIGTSDTIIADLHVHFFPEETASFDAALRLCTRSVREYVAALRRDGDFAGKDDEAFGSKVGGKRFLFVGCGKRNTLSKEAFRRAGARAVKAQRPAAVERIAFHLPSIDASRDVTKIESCDVAASLVEGALLALYSFDKYKTSSDTKKNKIESIIVCYHAAASDRRIPESVKRIATICDGVAFARDLANEPGASLPAPELAARAAKALRPLDVRVEIFSKKKIEQLRMGGLLAVNRGSAREPRFIVMEYNRAATRRPRIVLVGKGVTFDSGGISIKPAANMDEMKMDMSGAAAVIATMMTAARLKLPVQLIGLVPATDNMPSGAALCPGDVIRISNGTTVEVENTDAEGRLILADALSYAARYKPDAVIDLATLTGAVVVALGYHATGLMSNDDALAAQLVAAGDGTYERLWRLPLFDEYDKQIKSEIADVKNLGGRWGGAITAAKFLQRFVGSFPWAHLDIAGTAMREEPGYYWQKGGSGVGVRLLIEYLESLKKRN